MLSDDPFYYVIDQLSAVVKSGIKGLNEVIWFAIFKWEYFFSEPEMGLIPGRDGAFFEFLARFHPDKQALRRPQGACTLVRRHPSPTRDVTPPPLRKNRDKTSVLC